MSNYEKEKALLARARETFVKIDLLNLQERTIGSLEGKVTTGSVNIDGSSSTRRTLSLAFIVTDDNYKILETSNPISLNKKIKVGIGIKNYDDPDHPLSWFNIGVFVMKTVSISNSTSGATISLQASDKMCLHNGEVGGKLNASTEIGVEIVTDQYNALVVTAQGYLETLGKTTFNATVLASLRTTLMQMLNLAYGSNYSLQTNLEFLISECDTLTAITPDYKDRIKNMTSVFSSMASGINKTKLSIADTIRYLAINFGGELPGKVLIDVPEKAKVARWINQKDNVIGFSMMKYTLQKELVLNAGQPITVAYDQCVSDLGGNYEYFYDVDGNFVFQEKKNYLYDNIIPLDELRPSNYKYEFDKVGVQYDFSSDSIISSYSNSPNWMNIKNDLYVWGMDDKTVIGYHVAIDDKPIIQPYNKNLLEGKLIDWREWIVHNYNIGESANFVGKAMVEDLNQFNADVVKYNIKNPVCLGITKTDDSYSAKYYSYSGSWVEFKPQPADLGFMPRYYAELASYWCSDRFGTDPTGACNYVPITKSKYTYNLDIIEGDGDLSKFSIKTIGLRTEAVNDKDVKRLYPTIVQDILIYSDDEDLQYTSSPESAIKLATPEDIMNYPNDVSIYKDAFSTIKQLLWDKTSFNEQITITSLPLYHLEVNRRNYIYNEETSINGYFLSNKISYNLNDFGQMTMQLTKINKLDN